MKTKFKTLPESQKKSILKNRNFLNSQNYILGKSEKKKLLSKFFIERLIFMYNNKLKLINNNLPNGLLIYLILYFVLFIVYPYSIWNYPKNPIAWIIFTTSILFLTFFYYKDSLIFKWNNFKYSNKSYFIIYKFSYFHLFIKYIIIIYIIQYFFNINFIVLNLLFILTFIFIFIDLFKILILPLFFFIINYNYNL